MVGIPQFFTALLAADPLNASYSIGQMLSAGLTIFGLLATAYGLHVNIKNRQKNQLKENEASALAFAEVKNSISNIGMRQDNLLQLITDLKNETKTALSAMGINKDDILRLRLEIEKLRTTFDGSNEIIQKELMNIESRLNKGNL
jgi:hypothetical protein